MSRPSVPPFRAEAVLFDFDGTLTRPGAIDFEAVRQALHCPPDMYILEFVDGLPEGEERQRARATLERFELEGAARSEPNEGAEGVVQQLRGLSLPLGILTRNGRAAVERGLERCAHIGPADFDVIVTRDDDVLPKPAPDGIRLAARRLGVPVEHMLVVGDFRLDMQAGRNAGAVTVYLTNSEGCERPGDATAESPEAADCDFVIRRLNDLEAVVRLGLPLPQGKLPNQLLARYLGGLDVADPAVLVGAGVGEDVAALDVSGDEVMVVHGDPITLTSADLGRLAVLVNANDIATSGGEPRWLLTTVLLPAGTTPSEALHLLENIAATSAGAGIALVGGHTEITAAVTRPVVAATMLGTLPRADLRDKRGVAEGDHVLLTKALAIEGTALLAGELPDRLRTLGMTAEQLAACRHLLDRLSISEEARIARGFAGVRALHDITEGGLATALEELSVACGHAITVRRETVPVYPETQQLCGLLGADPLGLIGSGSLLACCRPDESEPLVSTLGRAGIAATLIGVVGGPGAGVTALENGRAASWPHFETDEAARLLQD